MATKQKPAKDRVRNKLKALKAKLKKGQKK